MTIDSVEYKKIIEEIKRLKNDISVGEALMKLEDNNEFNLVFTKYIFNDYLKELVSKIDVNNNIEMLRCISTLQKLFNNIKMELETNKHSLEENKQYLIHLGEDNE